MTKLYQRKEKSTLSNVTIDEGQNIVKGTNDIGSPVVMTVKQFEELYDRGIPRSPHYTYKDDPNWLGMTDFLGYENSNVSNENLYVSYGEAENYVKKFNFLRVEDYLVYHAKNLFTINLPKYPHNHYKKYSNEWKGWVKFLGKKKKNNQ